MSNGIYKALAPYSTHSEIESSVKKINFNKLIIRLTYHQLKIREARMWQKFFYGVAAQLCMVSLQNEKWQICCGSKQPRSAATYGRMPTLVVWHNLDRIQMN